jgi:hypothetical protein
VAAPTEVQRSVTQANVWKLGYQQRQFGLSNAPDDPDIVNGLANPPATMVSAKAATE